MSEEFERAVQELDSMSATDIEDKKFEIVKAPNMPDWGSTRSIEVPESTRRRPRDPGMESSFTKKWQKTGKARKRARKIQNNSRRINRGK